MFHCNRTRSSEAYTVRTSANYQTIRNANLVLEHLRQSQVLAGGRADGWNLFRPEALSLKGLGTLNTYNSSVSAVVSHKPLSCPFPQNFPIPLASCLDY
jgi:hypothetical protein